MLAKAGGRATPLLPLPLLCPLLLPLVVLVPAMLRRPARRAVDEGAAFAGKSPAELSARAARPASPPYGSGAGAAVVAAASP